MSNPSTTDQDSPDVTKIGRTESDTESNSIPSKGTGEVEGQRDLDEGIDAPSERHQDKPKKTEKARVKFKSTMRRRETATYFRSLIEGLESGRLVFRQKDVELELTPADQMSVEIKASSKGSRQKILFELEWDMESPGIEIDS